jgi:histidinol-phosphate phosphatase family protein
MRAGADAAAREKEERQLSRPAVFLDRDGTLVEEVPYLHDPERVVLSGGVEALSAVAASGYALVVVTNQAGVARGLYDEVAVAAVHRRMAELLAGAGVRLDAVLHCPHHPEGTVPGYARPCRCRKPGPGMLEAAAAGRGRRLRRPGGRHPGRAGRHAGRRRARAHERGQARSGRDGAGLAGDAGWSRATAPLTGTSSGGSGPPRVLRMTSPDGHPGPPGHRHLPLCPCPPAGTGGLLLCLRRYLCGGRAERSRRTRAPSVPRVTGPG